MADRCRIVIEAVLKYAQEMLGSTSNLNLPPDLKVTSFDSLPNVLNTYCLFTR